jgi:2-desacetyl-2-hydroxyethyl bacteriochlorophyllide A dehydrogenase
VVVRELDDPVIQQPGDAIVRVDLAGLCGSDLHPYFGREVGLDTGTVMGHEFVGRVVAVGAAVARLQVGDRVAAPFTTSCGNCFYCSRGLTSRCVQAELFGWRENGNGLHGGQASLVRVPLADSTLMKLAPWISDETALLLGDNLSTGYFAAEMAGITADGTYAVVGCGTVGLLATVAAFRQGARSIVAIDPNESRLHVAHRLGARPFSDAVQARAAVLDQTQGRGADGVMELVGLPAAQKLAYDLLRPGGTLAVIGCHCEPHFAFSPADAYNKNLSYRTGRCPARHFMSRLATSLEDNPLDLSWCITHRFAIEQAQQAYDTFAHHRDGCIKAVFQFD